MLRMLIMIALLWPAAAQGAEVRKERFSKGAADAAQAYRAHGTARIGVLVVATDRSPDPGLDYADWNLLTDHRQLEGDPHRMRQDYELRLYEAIRGAFAGQGYDVQCLNREPWKGRKLKDLFGSAGPGGAVCAAHYRIRRTRKILQADGKDWWTPFPGMSLDVELSLYDASSGDLIHEVDLESLGTKQLYAAKTDLVTEQPLYPTGYDIHGSPNAYKIAIYNTGEKDLKGNKEAIPIIRTAGGSLDITVKLGRWTLDRAVDEDRMRRMDIPVPEDVAEQNSVLSRLLEYVPYRPQPEDIEYYDLESIDRCGRLLSDRIPPRPGS